MHRRFWAGVVALGLALGGVLVGALPASADGSGGPNAPVAWYSFAPAAVTVDATPGTGSHVAVVSLFRVADGALVDQCPDVDMANSSPPFAWGHEGPAHCPYSGLDPGAWRLLTQQDHDNGHSYTASDFTVDDYIIIPSPPSIGSAALASDGSVAIAGTGAPGDLIHVSDGGGSGVCDGTIDEGGSWTCGVGPGYDASATFTAIEENTRPRGEAVASVHVAGGLSAPSGAVQVTGAPPPPPALDPNWTFSLAGIDLSNIRPGDTLSITAAGLPPGLDVSIVLHSDPVTLATTAVGGDGRFSATGTIPLNTEPGVHRIVVSLSGGGISPVSKEAVITIVGPVPPTTTRGTPSVVPASSPQANLQPAAVVAPLLAVPEGVIEKPVPAKATEVAEHEAEEPAGEHEEAAEHEPAAEHGESGVAPNILTNALQPIQHVLSNPATVASALSIGLVLIVLAAVPGHLLNATIAEQYQRFSGRLSGLRRPGWFVALTAWMAKESALAGFLLVVATALLFGFGDPHFGFNDHSLRLIIGCAIGLFFVAFVSSWLTGLILKVRWSVVTQISFRPLGLVLTLFGVIASRILDFSPGFLIGLVLGLSISSGASKEYAWRAVAIRSSIIIAFGIAAWIGFSVLTLHGEPHDFLGALLVETCVAITTEGIVMLLIDLLPIKLLSGELLFAHSKLLWGGLYLVVTTIFIVGVVAWEGHWRELGSSLWLWIGVVVTFAVICIAIYLYFRFWAPPLPEETADEEEPLARVE